MKFRGNRRLARLAGCAALTVAVAGMAAAAPAQVQATGIEF
jgi:hypothetical protein